MSEAMYKEAQVMEKIDQLQPEINTSFLSEHPREEEHLQKKGVDEELELMWVNINKTNNHTELAALIKQYCVKIVGSGDEDIFINHFIESRFLEIIRCKLKEYHQSGELLRAIFSVFEFLLKALKKDQQLIYFLVKINQEGFISQDYVFREEEDEAYYANFLKLMVRKINEDHKYLSVFFNLREPHFPLLLQLLKMYDCKDSIMHTSSKLSILQISNNPTPLVQTYMQNFPFVLLYPLYVSQAAAFLREVVNEDDSSLHDRSLRGQYLQSSLKYMQEFVEKKDRVAIDMYTNSFLKIVGRFIYWELINLNQKNIRKTIRLLKTILTYVLSEVSGVKIRTSLFCLFANTISSKMKKCFQGKVQELQRKYWLPEACSVEVMKHCKAIFYNEESQSKSLLKALNSYIPRSKDNWLYHELKKLSDIIGFQISLYSPINFDKYQPDSFLDALSTIIDDKLIRNDIFGCIMVTFDLFQKAKNQELLYYYLRVVTELCDSRGVQGQLEFEQLSQAMVGSSSLALMQVFHNLVVKSKMRVNHSELLNEIYVRVTQKLVHFVLVKGWKELLLRIRESRCPGNDISFSPDIYREIECEILLFVSLRTLMGTDNSHCSRFEIQRWTQYPQITCETIFKCHESTKFGSAIFAILDGQFLNLKNREEILINKQELHLSELHFYEDGEKVEVYGSAKNGNFCASLYLEREMRSYMLKEIACRKEMEERVSLELKQLFFEFNYQ